MNNQEENKWYAIHYPEDPEGDAQIAKNMDYAAETGALKPDEYGIVPKMLPFEGHEFEDNEILPMTPEELDLGGQPTVVDENLPGQPQGSFGMNGVQYRYVNGRWTALKPDGTPMNDAEFYELTSQRAKKRPGNVTGRPLLPSRLFEKPTIAQR